jgi:hypothetical protein
VIGLERDVQELGRIADAGHGVERGLRIGGMARDAAESFWIVDPAERRGADRIVRGGFRDG